MSLNQKLAQALQAHSSSAVGPSVVVTDGQMRPAARAARAAPAPTALPAPNTSVSKPPKDTKVATTTLTEKLRQKLAHQQETTMPLKKLSADQLAKVREIDAVDAANAIEFGFAKAAHDLGLNEKEYDEFYADALERLQQQSAGKA